MQSIHLNITCMKQLNYRYFTQYACIIGVEIMCNTPKTTYILHVCHICNTHVPHVLLYYHKQSIIAIVKFVRKICANCVMFCSNSGQGDIDKEKATLAAAIAVPIVLIAIIAVILVAMFMIKKRKDAAGSGRASPEQKHPPPQAVQGL